MSGGVPAGVMPLRRRWLLGSVAATAGLAGVGAAWWRYRPALPLAGAEEALWQQDFAMPAGGRLAMQSLRGRPLLLNFWATWCPPCIEEMPLIDQFFKENRTNGWQVLGLAIDQPTAVRGFLQKRPVAYPMGLAGLGGTELGRSLGNLAGGLPFTVLLGAGGMVLHRKMGQLTPADLQLWAGLK